MHYLDDFFMLGPPSSIQCHQNLEFFKTPTLGVPLQRCSSIFIGVAVPPVPPKLVERIKAGDFIDMAELLSNRMGLSSVDESISKKLDVAQSPTLLNGYSALMFTCL